MTRGLELGWRFFLLDTDHRAQLRPPYFDDLIWPAGWAAATCSLGCTIDEVPNSHCTCGIAVMPHLWHVIWYLLSIPRFRDDIERIVFAKCAVRGRQVIRPEMYEHVYPAEEYQVEQARITDLWVPQSAAGVADPLREYYGVPVHVSDRCGHDWLREMAPALLDALDVPSRPERKGPAPDQVEMLREGIALIRTFPDNPQNRATIARAEATVRRLTAE